MRVRLMGLTLLLCLGWAAIDVDGWAARAGPRRDINALPATPPLLLNPGLECTEGYYDPEGVVGNVPNGWRGLILNGSPRVNSTRVLVSGNNQCNLNAPGHVERLEGNDSWIFRAKDLETPPEPGKPFDGLLYQQVAVVPGVAYSVSAWLLSLCGGTAADCPDGYYIAKMLGVDPNGGVDPLASSVLWVEDRRSHVEAGWVNLRLGFTAQAITTTLFVRLNSPFQWHGNHGFIDAVSIVQAPTAHFITMPGQVASLAVPVHWGGDLGPDIPTIPGGTYRLYFDVEVREGATGSWQPWLEGQPAGGALFWAGEAPVPRDFYFRVRARAEQPPAPPAGAWPNHRYPGEWVESRPVTVPPITLSYREFLPVIER